MTDDLTFDVIRDQNALTICFGSTMENIDQADAEVKQLLCDMGLSRHTFSIRIVLREGLTNSVRHAHNYDPGKLIRLNVNVDKTTLTMTIEDQGDGFDWKTRLLDRNDDSDKSPPQDHGRGILIMNDYVDNYWYNDKGNILTMKKDISS